MAPARRSPWSLEDIRFSDIEVDRIRDDDTFFLLVCSASFVESGSDRYTSNLVEHFADDDEVGTWLREQWEPEELQHGHALKTYVQHVWPEFNWDAAYAVFYADYSRLCTMEKLEPTRGQELAARCIVEMGTTTYYQALNSACTEPVLRDLTWRIRTDEVRHYKNFHAFFQKYQRTHRLGRRHVLAALVRRTLELRREDATIALRHALEWRCRSRLGCDLTANDLSAADLTRQAYQLVTDHLPMDLAVRMALQPLQLPPGLQRWLVRPIAALGAGIIRP